MCTSLDLFIQVAEKGQAVSNHNHLGALHMLLSVRYDLKKVHLKVMIVIKIGTSCVTPPRLALKLQHMSRLHEHYFSEKAFLKL